CERDQRLARVDADPDLKLPALRDPIANRERRSNSPLGIVLVRDGRPEEGHDCVADELLDRAAEALEFGAQPSVVGRKQGAHVLWIESFRACREANQIAEEAADDLALLLRERRNGLGERCRAERAEAKIAGKLLGAARAGRHEIESRPCVICPPLTERLQSE